MDFLQVFVINFQRFNILLPFIDTFLVCCAVGFLDSMFEHHLASKPINAAPGQVGLVFLIIGAVYTVASLIGGWVNDFEH